MSKHLIYFAIIVLFISSVKSAASRDFVSLSKINGNQETKLNLSVASGDYIPQDTTPTEKEYELLEKGYNYIDSKQYNEAISVFNEYLVSKPNDIKVHLQLGYLYDEIKDYKNAYNSFSYVAENSIDIEEVNKAKASMKYLRKVIINESNVVSKDSIQSSDTINVDKNTDLLNKGYNYINLKQYGEAISVFKTYLNSKPNDTKIHLQLGYLYDATKKYENAYNSFSYVADNSTNGDEIDKARTSMFFMRDLMIKNSKASYDLYFYNFYDSYYQNYVANLLTHINFKLTKGIYMGPYLETYLDSKSKTDYIINDRYFDIGGFTKFNITDWMNFELRVGYVREIDFKKNSLSFKPILSMGTRVGTATFYKDRKSTKTENFYFDIYSSGLYDYKFRNVFGDLMTKEVLRFLMGGYSYFEFYLKQEAALDTKKLDYNNYVDLGAGITFKPNINHFPVFFIEGLNRNFVVGSTGEYFSGDLRNIFTVRAGFLLYYNTKL